MSEKQVAIMKMFTEIKEFLVKNIQGNKKDVALVLSSGGARGLAHIGAIEELEARGYHIKSIAGTSMGALVAGMYATGHLKEFREWMKTIDKQRIRELTDYSPSLDHLVRGNKIIDALKALVPDCDIDDLPIPYAAVATDWESGHEVVFTHGSLYGAIRASISLPAYFSPVRTGGKILIDGGTTNPLPLNRVHREKGDMLVGVDVSAPFASPAPKTKVSLNYYKVLIASSEIMQQHIARLMCRLHKPDILVEMPADSYGIFEFYRSKELIEAGRTAMRAALERAAVGV